MAKGPQFAILMTYLVPVDSLEEAQHFKKPGSVPDNAPFYAEIVEKNDFQTEDDWDTMGFNLFRMFAGRVRRNGWPEKLPVEVKEHATAKVEGDLAGPAPASDTHEGIDFVTPPKRADGSCWSCGKAMITTKRGEFCPSGCVPYEDAQLAVSAPGSLSADDIEESGDSGMGRGGIEYLPTKESPRPTSFPTGPIIEPTD